MVAFVPWPSYSNSADNLLASSCEASVSARGHWCAYRAVGENAEQRPEPAPVCMRIRLGKTHGHLVCPVTEKTRRRLRRRARSIKGLATLRWQRRFRGRESSYMPDMTRKRAFRIGRSRTGLGLFATAPIKKGAFMVEYKGRKLTTEQANKLEARGNRYLYEINSRWTIDGTSRKNLGRYVNHSCRPNAETHTIGHKVIIRSIKNIRTGAEITYNYGRDYLTNVITRRGCKCDKCRKKRADARAKARVKSRRASRSRRRMGKKE